MLRQALLWIPRSTAGRNHQDGDCRAVDSGPNSPQMCFVGFYRQLEQRSSCPRGCRVSRRSTQLTPCPCSGSHQLALLTGPLVVLGICLCSLGSRSGPKVISPQGTQLPIPKATIRFCSFPSVFCLKCCEIPANHTHPHSTVSPKIPSVAKHR